MALFDLPLEELRSYRSDSPEPHDFDEFWERTLAEARSYDLGLTIEPVDAGLTLISTEDVTFAGFGGQPVKAWLTRPAGVTGDLPVVVEYIGYGGGRGRVHEHLAWAAAGYAHLLMDTRGQGSRWGTGGDTADPVGSGPAMPGSMTQGITSPDTYYYRRLIVDAVRAVDAARAIPGINPSQVAVTGISQGGGLTLAVAGLVGDLVAVMPDVPFLCHFRRAVTLTDEQPYREIADYLAVHRHAVEQTFTTLSYVDGVSFAQRATAPALFSTALMDMVCPPSTVFAAYNTYGERSGAAATGDRDITVYPFNGHEGGQGFRFDEQLGWLTARLHG